MKVAFIGLGNMGSGVAACILRAGYPLTVWNRTPAKMAPLVAAGATGAESARLAVEDADVVLTSLMDDASVLENLQGEQGFLAGMKPGAVHLCVTTISPGCADRLGEIHRAHGTGFVAGPIAGRPDSAAAGQLITFLAGDASAIEAVTKLCGAYARKVVPLGQRPGIAYCMKLCVNYTAVSCIELMSEVYTFAEKSGIAPQHVTDFFNDAFAHPALKTYAAKLKDRKFSSAGGFTMKGGLKDVRMMLATSAETGVSFDIGKVIERKMLLAIERGMEQDDWSAFSEITRLESGLVQEPS